VWPLVLVLVPLYAAFVVLCAPVLNWVSCIIPISVSL
jgi:hypothetical protein